MLKLMFEECLVVLLLRWETSLLLVSNIWLGDTAIIRIRYGVILFINLKWLLVNQFLILEFCNLLFFCYFNIGVEHLISCTIVWNFSKHWQIGCLHDLLILLQFLKHFEIFLLHDFSILINKCLKNYTLPFPLLQLQFLFCLWLD